MAEKFKQLDRSVKLPATSNPDKPLSPQQRELVQFIAKGESVGSASKRVYNNATMGYEAMKVPAVQKALAIEKAKYEEAADMDRRQVMEGLKESIEMAKLMSEPATMIQGWKVIAQMCGYMAPVETKLKIDVTGNVTMTKLTQLSDAELLEMIERGKSDASPQLLTDQTGLGEAD